MDFFHLRKIFTAAIYFIIPTFIVSEPGLDWFVSYNGTGEESMGHFIIECEDGGFLQVGETYFFTEPITTKLYVVKTDIDGEKIWDKEINIGGHNLGNSVIEAVDGYIIFGALNENSSIIKLSKSDGSIIYNKSYDYGGTDAFENGVLVPDGVVAVGYYEAQDAYNTFYTEGLGNIAFLNHEGEQIANVDLGFYISQAYRVKTYDNHLYISGLTQDALDYKLMKMSLNGEVIWHYEYGGGGDEHCFAMDINEQGEIFLAGHTNSGTENWDVYTIKLNNNGDMVWEQKSGNPRGFDPLYIHDEAWGVKATNDGGCLTVAGTGDEYDNYSECNSSGCSDIWNAYLIKYDQNGLISWESTYSPDDIGEEDYDWAGEDIALTSDGGAIVAIDNGQFGFLKLNNVTNTSSILEDQNKSYPYQFKLKQNHPNPFNSKTVIKFDLLDMAHTELNIYDLKGNKIKTLVEKVFNPGTHSISWDGMDFNNHKISSGVYFYYIKIKGLTQAKKMILLN